MLSKKVEMPYNDVAYHITYTKDFIDKNEIQFSIVDVKTKSGINIWKYPFTIHYYPLRKNKISMPFFTNEVLNKLKSEIVSKIIINEDIPL